MKKTITCGTRGSNLSIAQTRTALRFLETTFPLFRFELQPFSSPGDRDKNTAIQNAAPDFFTRDLDEAVLSGKIDCAVHSAKDLPDPLPDTIDWFRLPNPEDPRDVIVARPGTDLSANGTVFGNSSERREAYIRKRYPNALIKPLRGTIEERLAQLDDGKYDAILMAGAALNRLGLQDRATEWIPLNELETPDGQGWLTVTFRKGDPRFLILRSLFVKSVVFASAGVGDAGLCTVASIEALQHCDICLYDALMPDKLLEQLPENAEAVYVGKRSGRHSHDQKEISALITGYARQGIRVVRLKGGDAGMFGRLAEEIELLDELELPYRVIPGVSTLNVATTGTGLMLTRRGISRGFKVITTATAKDSDEPLIPDSDSLPTAIFMGIGKLKETTARLAPETPVSIVFNAGCPDEQIICGTAADIAAKTVPAITAPGIILTGETADSRWLYRKHGALRGEQIWLTCSEALQPEAQRIVRDFGGKPVGMPLIRLVPTKEALPDPENYDWLVLSSPSAVDCLMTHVSDLRNLPKILACGSGSANALKKYRLKPDAMPESDFSTEGILETARKELPADARILRLRSSAAGTVLSEALRRHFGQVDDFMLCRNEPVIYEKVPDCDTVFLASSSAVTNLTARFGPGYLKEKSVIAIGEKTAATLRDLNIEPDLVPSRATVRHALTEWAHKKVSIALEKLEESR